MSAVTKTKKIDPSKGDMAKPVSGLETDVRQRLAIGRQVVPIIFVPGIMGSRLKNSGGWKIWDPDDAKFMFRFYGTYKATAAKKRRLLVGKEFSPEHLKVFENDQKHNKRKFSHQYDAGRADRGWGGVSWSSYGTIINELQTRQWDRTVNLFAEFPVHAFGYNWTASNRLAGERLAGYIDAVITKYRDMGRQCEKVILVTHSMGGLVARAACKLSGAESRVLGVIHGVQPANGSPAGYWRMKGGFERPHTIPETDPMHWLKTPKSAAAHKWNTLVTKGVEFAPGISIGKGNITAWVLGSDGREVTALLGNMPGGLQLLPNKRYRDNHGCAQWLVLRDESGKRRNLPKSDPYKEIYRAKDVYWRLVNPDWLNPGVTQDTAKPGAKNSWQYYLGYLQQAETFHDSLGGKVHPNTYQFYSTGIASPDRVVFTRMRDTLRSKGKRIIDMVKGDLLGMGAGVAVDAAKGELSKPVTGAAKATLAKPFAGSSWSEYVLHPSKLVTAAKGLAGAAKQVPGAMAEAVKGLPNALPQIAAGMPKTIGINAAKKAATTAIGLLVRDDKRFIDRGGYRNKVDESDLLVFKDNGSPAEVAFLITLETPDGAGDGTVPESSAKALKLGANRTFAIGDLDGNEGKFVEKKAPRTRPQIPPDFDEGWFDRGHEPIYKTRSATRITVTAIENMVRELGRKALGLQ